MEAVLSLRREPGPFLYLWSLWVKIPALLWFVVLFGEVYALTLIRAAA